MYAPGRLDPVKLCFFVDTGCTHNPLSKATFDCLLTAIKERLEAWDTTVMLADEVDQRKNYTVGPNQELNGGPCQLHLG